MSTESASADCGELRLAIGRGEGRVDSLDDGQRELREETRKGFAEVNRRLDRLFYTILGVGGASIAVLLADRFIPAG